MKKIIIIIFLTIIILAGIYFLISLIIEDNPKPEPTTDKSIYKVTEVVDGDTIKVNIDGGVETVRVVGIDTTEKGECFYEEASDRAGELLSGKQVALLADPTQENRDKYDRLLRYVFIGDTDFGESMISGGYAHEYTYEVPYEHRDLYISLEESARETGAGLWSVDTCNGAI